MSSSRTRVVASGALVALALGAAACSQQAENTLSIGGETTTTTGSPTPTTGGSTGDGSSTGAALGHLTPAASAAYLSAAAEKTSAASTGRFTMSMSMTGLPGTTGTVEYAKATGAFDEAAHRTSMTMDLSSMLSALPNPDSGSTGGSGGLGAFGDAFGEPMQMVTDGGTAYIKWGLLSSMAGVQTPWVSMDTSGVSARGAGGTNPMGQVTGEEYLTLLSDSGAQVTEVGQDQIDGVTATHYHAVLDLASLASAGAAQVPADERERFDAVLEQFAGKVDLPVDVWIGDEDNHVRRISLTMNFGGIESAIGGDTTGMLDEAGMAMQIDFTGIGEPVDIAVPPADQVTTIDPSELRGGFGGLGGLGSGAGGGSTRKRTTTTTAG